MSHPSIADISTPTAHRLTPSEWKMVLENLHDDSAQNTSFYIDFLHPKGQPPVVMITAGSTEKKWMGYQLGNRWQINQMGQMNHDRPSEKMSCWDKNSKQWIKPKNIKSFDLDKDAKAIDKQISYTHEQNLLTSTGNSPHILRITRYDTNEVAWSMLVKKLPNSLHLDKFKWPTYVYRVEHSQADDRICRNPSENGHSLVNGVKSPSQMTSGTIVKTLHPQLNKDSYTLGNHSYTIINDDPVTWDVIHTNVGLNLVRLKQDSAVKVPAAYRGYKYYAINNGQLVPVLYEPHYSFTDREDSMTRLTFKQSAIKRLLTFIQKNN